MKTKTNIPKRRQQIYHGDKIDQIAKNLETRASTTTNTTLILKYAIIGFVELAILISLAYSTYKVLDETDDLVSRILVAPQILLGVGILLYIFVYNPVKNHKENH